MQFFWSNGNVLNLHPGSGRTGVYICKVHWALLHLRSLHFTARKIYFKKVLKNGNHRDIITKKGREGGREGKERMKEGRKEKKRKYLLCILQVAKATRGQLPKLSCRTMKWSLEAGENSQHSLGKLPPADITFSMQNASLSNLAFLPGW